MDNIPAVTARFARDEVEKMWHNCHSAVPEIYGRNKPEGV